MDLGVRKSGSPRREGGSPEGREEVSQGGRKPCRGEGREGSLKVLEEIDGVFLLPKEGRKEGRKEALGESAKASY